MTTVNEKYVAPVQGKPGEVQTTRICIEPDDMDK